MYQMVHKRHIDVQVHTRAAVHDVYALLRDGSSWPRWTGIDSFEWEPAGADQPEQVGTIRTFRKAHAHTTASRER